MQVGAHLMSGLNGIAERRPGLLSRIRGLGTFIAFDLPSGGQRDKLLSVLRSKGKCAGGKSVLKRNAAKRQQNVARDR